METENQSPLDWSKIITLDDVLVDEVCCLEGLGELLGDLARASDIPGDPIKIAQISIGALFALEESIRAAVKRIRATTERVQGDLSASGAFETLKAFHANGSRVTAVGGQGRKRAAERA